MSEQPKQDPNEERLLDDNYDGIQEYDNPMPRWWVGIFWATIVFAVVYVLNLIPGVGTGPGRVANYDREMREAGARLAALEASHPGVELSEAMVFGFTRDPAALAAGRQTFATTCAPCHQPDGGGNIGPNLTDDFWIHGNRPMDLVRTITIGVPDKGMPTWGGALKSEQVGQVAAYILTMHGTHPASPKAPQGVRMEVARPAATASP